MGIAINTDLTLSVSLGKVDYFSEIELIGIYVNLKSQLQNSFILEASLSPENTTDREIVWETNSDKISIIPNGEECTVKILRGAIDEFVTITCKSVNNESIYGQYSTLVTYDDSVVVPITGITNITFTDAGKNLIQCTPVFEPIDTTQTEVSWTTSGAGSSIDENGLLSYSMNGTVTVTCTSLNDETITFSQSYEVEFEDEIVEISDPYFKQGMLKACDTNKDGEIQLSEANSLESIMFSNTAGSSPFKGIAENVLDATDLEKFTNVNTVTNIVRMKNCKKISFPNSVTSLSAIGTANSADLPISWEIVNFNQIHANLPNNCLANTHITEQYIPGTIESIGGQCFSDTQELETVIFGEGVKNFGANVFQSSSVKEIHFPSTVETFGQQMFRKTNLNTIILPVNTPIPFNNFFYLATTTNLSIYVPDETVDAWKEAWPSVATKFKPLSEWEEE